MWARHRLNIEEYLDGVHGTWCILRAEAGMNDNINIDGDIFQGNS